jgi:hypothetical protein
MHKRRTRCFGGNGHGASGHLSHPTTEVAMFTTVLIRAKWLLGLILALQMSGLSTHASAESLPNRNFWVGYNEAWFGDSNYGNWLSSNPTYSQSSQFNATLGVLDRYFDAMEDGNARIVRIWLFPALQGIKLNPPSPSAAQTQGLTSEFLGNLETVLARARSHRLKVYITLLNGVDMYNIWRAAQSNTDPFLQMLYTYFGNLLLNKNGELTAYKTKVLSPLLQLLTRYRHEIYGIDLMNEIEGPALAGYFPNLPFDARGLISDMASFVKMNSPEIPVTSSAGFGIGVDEITMGLYSGLGLDFYDVHIYADFGRYVGQAELCKAVTTEGKQIILGEYGQGSTNQNDILQSLTTASFLLGAQRSCFSSALAWKFETTSQNWFSYLRQADRYGRLSFRPAYYTVRAFGAFGLR